MLIKSFHLLSFVPRYLQTGKTMTESKCIRKYPKCLQSMKKLRVVDYGLTFPLVVTVITILNIPGVVIWGRTSMKVHFCLTAWHKGVTRMTCSFKSKIKLECGPGNFYQVKCNFTPLDMAHIWGGRERQSILQREALWTTNNFCTREAFPSISAPSHFAQCGLSRTNPSQCQDSVL